MFPLTIGFFVRLVEMWLNWLIFKFEYVRAVVAEYDYYLRVRLFYCFKFKLRFSILRVYLNHIYSQAAEKHR